MVNSHVKKRFIDDYWFYKYPGLDDWPEDPYNAYSSMDVNIGHEGEAGFYTYRFHLYTIKKLEEIIKEHKFAFGRYMLIVEKFDHDLIKKAITTILPEIEKYGDDVS